MKQFDTYLCGSGISAEEAWKRSVVFETMRCDMGVMAEWGDDEEGLWKEIHTCDSDILSVYFETFCASEKVPCI